MRNGIQPSRRHSPSPFLEDQSESADATRSDELASANRRNPLFPLTKNWRVVVTCYSLWVLLVLYGHITHHRLGSGWTIASTFLSPLIHVGAFAFLAPLPWLLPRNLRSPWRFVVGFTLSLIGCEIVAALLPVIDAWILAHGTLKFNMGRLVDLYTSLVGPAMMIVGGLVAAQARSEERREASEVEALIAKNRLLQSQIHPHVLFNALNGLAELIHKNPDDAEIAVRHLSDLLRRIMQASEHTLLPLREEKQIITDFLALEAIRLGKRLRITWEWDDTLDQVEIPPLLLQPLVENAIKHGIAPSIPGGEVHIRARGLDGILFLEVWNTGLPYEEKKRPGGLGMRNLSSRLSLHFGSRAELSIGPSGLGTLASIRLEVTRVECSNETTKDPSS